MCDECGGTCGNVDTMTNPGGTVAAGLATRDPDFHVKAAISQFNELKRQSEKLYDFSHPVDEYASFPSVPATGLITWQPDYEIPARVETVTASLPVGMTGALLQLGERSIPLYSGAATAVQTIISLPYMGIILNRSDPRLLTFTGSPTNGGYIGLSGHCLEAGTGTR